MWTALALFLRTPSCGSCYDRTAKRFGWRDTTKNMSLIILILVLLLLFGSLPTWGYSRSWGYGPSGGLGTILLIVLILYLLNYIH